MKKTLALFVILLLSVSVNASLPKILVTEVMTEGVSIQPVSATALLRLELDKTKMFSTLDKNDIPNADSLRKLKAFTCQSFDCFIESGRLSNADKVITGSILKFGNKIAITLKLFDVKNALIEKTEVAEFIDLESEIQSMVAITVNMMFGISNNKQLLDNLLYFNKISEVPISKINNNGPRMGMAYVGGEAGKRLTAPESQGGYGISHVFSQIGYQVEAQYLSAGNLQALVEFLFMASGLDQQLFIPSLTIMNGFRLGDSGYELAFGPSFKIQKKAYGFYDDNGNWQLERELFGVTDSLGSYQRPDYVMQNIDSRGSAKFSSGWVWAIGRTFRSGYLNIPVNLYFSKSKDGWFSGVSFGFNIRSRNQ